MCAQKSGMRLNLCTPKRVVYAKNCAHQNTRCTSKRAVCTKNCIYQNSWYVSKKSSGEAEFCPPGGQNFISRLAAKVFGSPRGIISGLYLSSMPSQISGSWELYQRLLSLQPSDLEALGEYSLSEYFYSEYSSTLVGTSKASY